MRLFVLLSILLFFSIYTSKAQNSILQIEAKTLDNKKIKLNDIPNTKAFVVVFLSPECPLCQNYSLTLNNLYTKFQKDSIEFIGIFSGAKYTISEIKNYCNEYGIKFKTIVDKDYKFRNLLKASVTPEVFLVNKNEVVLYSGRIDNWAISLGKHREKANEHNLQNSIDLFIQNKPIISKYRPAVGCIIE